MNNESVQKSMPNTRRVNGAVGRVIADIERTGVHITYVMGDEESAPWAYTAGMTERSLPELVIHGVGPELTDYLLNALAKQLLAGAIFEPNENIPDVIQRPYHIQLGRVMAREAKGFPLSTANGLYDNVTWRSVKVPEADGGFYPTIEELGLTAFGSAA